MTFHQVIADPLPARAGIPALYFVLLYTNRDKIAPRPRVPEILEENRAAMPADDRRRRSSLALNVLEAQLQQRDAHAQDIAHLSFLYKDYEPRCMYFEVVECVRKLMLTGMLTFFYPETPSQIFIGVIIAVSSGFIYAYFKPFVSDEDALVSAIAQYQIFFVLVAALMSMVSSPEYVSDDADPGDAYTQSRFGWLLVVASIIGPGIAFAMLLREKAADLREIYGLLKACICERTDDGGVERTGTNTTANPVHGEATGGGSRRPRGRRARGGGDCRCGRHPLCE